MHVEKKIDQLADDDASSQKGCSREDADEYSRRSFFVRILGFLSACIAAIVAVPALGFILTPLLEKYKSRGLSKLGPVSQFPEGSPTLASLVMLGADNTLTKQGLYVVNQGSGNFDIFRLNCTHLGCPYEWNAAANKFFCPCHGGVFTVKGEVIGGPPPRPLDRYTPVIRDGILYAGQLMLGGTKPVEG